VFEEPARMKRASEAGRGVRLIFQIALSVRGDPLGRRRRGSRRGDSAAAGSAAWWRLPPAGRSASARGRAGYWGDSGMRGGDEGGICPGGNWK
jgi:hypothetical protein